MEVWRVSEWSRGDVLRIFKIPERQLRLWERNGLIASADRYGFAELGQLRKLRDLGAQRLPASSIRDAVHAMRAVSGLQEPLLEASLHVNRDRLVFRHSGAVMEPIGGQYVLDFSGRGRPAVAAIHSLSMLDRGREASRLFAEAVRAEESGQVDAAVEAYGAVLALAPRHAASAINLGTLYYGRRDYARAEHYYRMATACEPGYALAFFDLGNVLDELKRFPEAMEAYRRALAINPRYADAHYNLALALEHTGKRRSALAHWTAYLRLDREGAWAAHARGQVRKTLSVLGFRLIQGRRIQGL